MTFINFAKKLFRIFFHLFYRVELHGFENIPDRGEAYVLCANHANWMDPLLIGCFYPETIRFMAKKELFEIPLLRTFVVKLGAFPVNRQGNDLVAIKHAVQILKGNEIFGIFPEGTRNPSEDFLSIKPGIAVIALKAKKDVVPVAIVAENHYRLFSKLHIVIGDRIRLHDYFSLKRIPKDTYQDISNDIMKTIYSLKRQIQTGKQPKGGSPWKSS